MAKNRINIAIGANLKQFSSDMQNVQREMRKTSRKMKSLGKSMTRSLTLPLGLMGGAMIKFASDTQESLNKVDVAFGESSTTVKDFAKTTLKSFGIAEGSALDMASTFGDMATSMGIGQEAAAQMSNKLVGLAGDLASFKNIRIDVAQTALNSIFTGETESLKKLGIVMTQANLSAFALEKGITKPIKQMSEGEKVMLRYNYVMEKTSNAHGDFERTGGGAANQIRVFQEGLKELAATFGQKILPVFTKIVKKLNKVVDWFLGLSERTQEIIIGLGLLTTILGPFLTVLSNMLPIFGALKIATKAFYASMGLLGVAIVAVVAAGVLIYKNWDKITDKFWEVYDSSKMLRVGINGVALTFKLLYEVGKLALTSLWAVVKGIGGSIADFFGGLGELIAGVFTMDIDKIKSGFSRASNSFKDNMGQAFDDISKKASESFEAMKQDAKDFTDAVKNESESLSRNPIKIKVKGVVEKTDSDLDLDDGGGYVKTPFEDLGIKAKEYAEGLREVADATREMQAEAVNVQPVMDSVATRMQNFRENMVNAASALREGIMNLSMEAFEGFFEAIGRSIRGQEDAFKNFGQETLQNVANFMSQFGKLLVAGAIASEAMQELLFKHPVAAAAAGVALIAIAGVIKGMTSQNPTTYGGGSSYNPPSTGGGSSYFGTSNDVMTLETVVYGRDIVLSSNRQHGTISRTRRK